MMLVFSKVIALEFFEREVFRIAMQHALPFCEGHVLNGEVFRIAMQHALPFCEGHIRM